MADEVKIPSKAVSEGADVVEPTRQLLRGVQLLGDSEHAGDGPGAVFGGPPQSVALIEAGATAAAKWWSAGAGAAIVVVWGSVVAWFGGQEVPVQVGVLGAAGIVTAALVLAVGYLLASDVRGRAGAAAATIDARSKMALAMLDGVETLYLRPPAETPPALVALSPALEVENHHGHHGAESEHWWAVAIEQNGDGKRRYVVVKDSVEERRLIDEIVFLSPASPAAAPENGRGRGKVAASRHT